jgi:hypothetical protein
MTFVNTGLLWLLPLAAIPIVLHLLTLFRLRTVELSTFRFLFDSYLQQRRRMKFLEALLTFLRTLFLIALVFVIARPMIRHWSDLFQIGSGGREVILLVDCSASMNAQTLGESAFTRAKKAAQAVVKNLGPEDKVTLVRVTSRPEEMFSSFSSDTAAIGDKIGNLVTTPARSNFYAAFVHLFGPEAPNRKQPVIYLFTDCQASGWNEVRNQGLEKILPAKTQLVVVNVGSREELPNQAVVGDAPPAQRAVVGLPVRLRARVANFSKKPAEVVLRAILDEKEISRKKLLLKPNQTETKAFYFTPTEARVHRGRFEITGNGNTDRFTDDDRYLFTFTAVPKIKVLLVDGSPSTDPELDETHYLRTIGDIFAHAPEADKVTKKTATGPEQLATLREIAKSLDLHEIREAALTPKELEDSSVVVLANCGGLTDAQFGQLRQFVAGGGGLLVFPGDKVAPDVYNSRFFKVPDVPKEFLTPVQLSPAKGDPTKEATYDRLVGIDFSHPVLSIFDDSGAKDPYFKDVLIYRRFPLTEPDRAAAEKANLWPLAKFASGSLALAQNQYGDGQVVVAAFPLNRWWSNLPVDPNGKEFVPLMLRLISHAQHRAELETKPAAVPGDVVEISATGAWNPAVCKVTDPKGIVTPVPLDRSGSRLFGVFEHTNVDGYYTIEARPEQAEGLKGTTRDLAVNLAPEESDFRVLDKDKFQKLLPGAKLTYVDASAEAQQVRGINEGLEEPIWRPLIYLMFVIIGVEFLLATLSGRKKKDYDDSAPADEDRVHQVSAGAWVGRMAGAKP